MIKYLGSKRVLLDAILEQVARCKGVRTVCDLFSGTSRVGHALKRAGYRVISNDHNRYAHCLAQCYVEADREELETPAQKLVDELNAMPGKEGYFTETFCNKARYFQAHNGARIDAIRDAIALKALPPLLEAVLLTSLMEAADRVDSTTGVQMAYLKSWAPRAHQPLNMRLPQLLPRSRFGQGLAFQLDALEALSNVESDLLYIDPPYNQHSYLGNYHIWESLVRWDKPDTYGVAQKRDDCRTRKSAFNSKRLARAAFEALIAKARAKYLLVSFSDEGFLDRPTVEAVLRQQGTLDVITIPHKRYVGAQIGIYNPQGEKVGRVSHLKNQEYLYLVSSAR